MTSHSVLPMDAAEARAIAHLVYEGIGGGTLFATGTLALTQLAGCVCVCRRCFCRQEWCRSPRRDTSSFDTVEAHSLIDGPRYYHVCRSTHTYWTLHRKRRRRAATYVIAAMALPICAWTLALPPFAPWHACPGATTVSLDVELHVSPLSYAVAVCWTLVYRHMGKVRGVNIDVAFPPLPVVDAFEVQVAHAARPTLPFVAKLCAVGARTCSVHDLLPASAYVVSVRQRVRGIWTALTSGAHCTTQSLRPRQPHVWPPVDQPAADSVTVTVAVEPHARGADHTTPRFTGSVVVQHRAVLTPEWSTSAVLNASLPSSSLASLFASPRYLRASGSPSTHAIAIVALRGLAPATTYEVRVRAIYQASGGPTPGGSTPAVGDTYWPFSDLVEHRTAHMGASPSSSPPVESLEVYRASELCGMDGQLPLRAFQHLSVTPRFFGRCLSEPLANVNAASLEASASLLARWGTTASTVEADSREVLAQRYMPSFRHSVLTRTCVLRRAEPFAEYIGCNGPDTQHYVCGPCYNFLDRCIGRLPVAECAESGVLDTCKCNASTAARSARTIGAMEVAFPNMMTLAPSHVPDPSSNFVQQFVEARPDSFPGYPQGRRCRQPPAAAESAARSPSARGTWYSLPVAGECAAGAAPAALSTDEGGSTCTWASAATRRIVHGNDLLAAGLVTDPSATHDVTLDGIQQNVEVVRRAFAQHPGHERCCGC